MSTWLGRVSMCKRGKLRRHAVAYEVVHREALAQPPSHLAGAHVGQRLRCTQQPRVSRHHARRQRRDAVPPHAHAVQAAPCRPVVRLYVAKERGVVVKEPRDRGGNVGATDKVNVEGVSMLRESSADEAEQMAGNVAA
eukprot:TRINITY_DN5533_c0_g1_i2.p1 TRINITY_DN5533_c0_g1~~TRINITY_DN5533_c0_g1_i2.p1  ORF type:complete len:138 (+),score=18.90 TRINITY_DN5533_c0_g1_i2:111-524(+)